MHTFHFGGNKNGTFRLNSVLETKEIFVIPNTSSEPRTKETSEMGFGKLNVGFGPFDIFFKNTHFQQNGQDHSIFIEMVLFFGTGFRYHGH